MLLIKVEPCVGFLYCCGELGVLCLVQTGIFGALDNVLEG